jgi:hemerythrin-like domain-containing protein
MERDAIALLKSDHDEVRKLLEKLASTTERAEKTRTDVLKKVAAALAAHTTIEEEIFYPAFRDAGTKNDEIMFFQAKEEHRAVDKLVLPDLQSTPVTSECFTGRVSVLRELIEHHVEEEEQEMFPRAKELLSTDQLTALGEQMAARKQELLSATR